MISSFIVQGLEGRILFSTIVGSGDLDGSTTDALYLVRADRLDCYDRVEFSVNGPGDTGFSVRYVLAVTADPSGKPLPVPGNALLQVVIRAPDSGQPARPVALRTADQPGSVRDSAIPSEVLASPVGGDVNRS